MSRRRQKILVVFGTRPEAIKLAPLIRELAGAGKDFLACVCVTGQHRSMLDQMLRSFRIVPHYDLHVMQEGQDLLEVSRRCLGRLRAVMEREQPDWVLVQGDTTTTLAAALAAFYGRVRLAHVEAGLRTGDHSQPFPEEVNRRLISHLAVLHFAPNLRARRNLLREGIRPQDIDVTGNTGMDALGYALRQPAPPLAVIPGLERRRDSRPLVLVTSHRRESFGGQLRGICLALRQVARRADVDVIYPVHLNPSVREPVERLLGNLPNIFLMAPLPYVPFIALMRHAHLILTDSGGIQEEAPALGKPVLVLRDVTERPEGVEAGTARLVGTDPKRIVAETLRLLEDPEAHARMSRVHHPYGDGQASRRIARILAAKGRGRKDW